MLNIAIASEFALAEKILQALENHPFGTKVAQITFVDLSAVEEERNLWFGKKAVAEVKLPETTWEGFDYIFFAADKQQMSHASAMAQASQTGAIVLDLHGLVANFDDVPVVVPFVNDDAVAGVRQRNIVALPDVQVTQAALAIAPLLREFTPSKVMVSSMLPASYLGDSGVVQLAGQTACLLNGLPINSDNEENEEESEKDENSDNAQPQRLAFDVFPNHSAVLSRQLQRVLPQIASATFHAVQVPVFYGLGQMVSLISDNVNDSLSNETAWQMVPFIQVQAKTVTPVSNGANENDDESQAVLHISDVAWDDGEMRFWSVADEQQFDIAFMAVALAQLVYER